MAEKKAAREQARETRDHQKKANAQIKMEEQISMAQKKETRRMTTRITLGKMKVTTEGVNLDHIYSGRTISRPIRFKN